MEEEAEARERAAREAAELQIEQAAEARAVAEQRAESLKATLGRLQREHREVRGRRGGSVHGEARGQRMWKRKGNHAEEPSHSSCTVHALPFALLPLPPDPPPSSLQIQLSDQLESAQAAARQAQEKSEFLEHKRLSDLHPFPSAPFPQSQLSEQLEASQAVARAAQEKSDFLEHERVPELVASLAGLPALLSENRAIKAQLEDALRGRQQAERLPELEGRVSELEGEVSEGAWEGVGA